MKPTQNNKFRPCPTLCKGIGFIMDLRTIIWNSPRSLENISVSKIPVFRIFGVYTFSDHNVNLCYTQRRATSTGLKTPFLIDGCQVSPDFPFVRREWKSGWVWWHDTDSGKSSYSFRSVPLLLCSPPNPHGLAWDGILVFAVTGRRLAAWNVTRLRPRVSRLII
jgi:hypothetical protein